MGIGFLNKSSTVNNWIFGIFFLEALRRFLVLELPQVRGKLEPYQLRNVWSICYKSFYYNNPKQG